jgi:Flp pilus assembly protein TadD
MWIRLASRLVLLAAAASVAIAPTAALAIPSQGETVTVPHSFQPGYDTYTEFHTGVADLKAGRYGEAEAHFSHVLAMVPTDADSMFLLGMARSGRGDLSGARRAFQDTLRLDSNRTFAHRELALIYLKQGQPDRARAEMAILQQRSAQCAGTCSEAGNLAESIKSLQAVMPAG